MKTIFKWLLRCIVALIVVYGAGRLFYKVTDGFTIGHITSDLPYRKDWDVRALTPEEKQLAEKALNQKYTYLAKGHQAYVFESEDHQYVIKFLKFQRITPKPWIPYLPLPEGWESWRQGKIASKEKRLEDLFSSWKIGFEDLKEEAGLLMVHLNKSHDLNKQMQITDKVGFEHTINLDDMVFLVQKKTQLLCPAIDAHMAAGDVDGAKQLLDRLLNLYVSECKRGLFEKDHWIMRNTGVSDGYPIHIDTGRFEKDDTLKSPEVAQREIFKKTVKFRPWLEKHYPVLAVYFENRIATLNDKGA